MPTLNTRIKLKYDTLANWSTANPVLLSGEVAVVAIPTDSESTVGQVTKPAIVFKVGDGTTEFNTLPYASGLAADVYSWAKAATKPSYTAGEVGADVAGTAAGLIGELDVTDSAVGGQYVSAVSQVDGKIQVTRASLPTVNIPEYTLQAGDEEGTIELLKDGAVVGTAVEVTGWTELVAEVAAKYVKPASGIPKSDLASDVQTSLGKADTAVQSIDEGTVNGTIAVDGEDISVHGLGSAAYTESSAYDAAGTATSAVNSHNISDTAHSDIRALITALQGQVGDLGNALRFVGVEDELPDSGESGDVVIVGDKEYVWANNAWNEFGSGDHITKAQADGYYDAKGTAQNLINGLDTTVSGAGAGKTIATLTETDGVIAATFQDIAITSSQVSGLGSLATKSAVEISEVTGLQDELDTKLESADIADLATKEELTTGLAGKQNTLSEVQLNAVNSGITAAKVATYDGYATNIAALEAKPGLDKVGTVTSVAGANGITVTGTATTTPVVEIDTTAVFILDCGTATTNIE